MKQSPINKTTNGDLIIAYKHGLLCFFIKSYSKCKISVRKRNLGFLFLEAAKESSLGGMCLNNEFVHRGRERNRGGFV